MFSWFGGQPSQAKKDAPKKAILELRTQLDMLNKREKYLESQIEEQQNIAKANVTKNKAMATTALKRKKAHETSLSQTSNQINMLENQIYTIEAANINQETVKAMQNANSAMKTINQGLTMDKVEQIMDDAQDNRELINEIGNRMSEAGQQDIAEDELEEQLAELEQENLDEAMLKTGTMPATMPSLPNTEPKGKAPAVAAEEDEEEELRKLQLEMAM